MSDLPDDHYRIAQDLLQHSLQADPASRGAALVTQRAQTHAVLALVDAVRQLVTVMQVKP